MSDLEKKLFNTLSSKTKPKSSPPKTRGKAKIDSQKTTNQTVNKTKTAIPVEKPIELPAEEPKKETPIPSLNEMKIDVGKIEEIKIGVSENKKEDDKDDKIYSMAYVEQKPLFPGGDAEMMKWLGSNINYPPQAAEEGVSGKVTVQFVVEKDGSISGVKVVRGKHPALDAEAVRVVKKMPKWTPGRNNGAPVRVTYMLPVTFRLQ